MGKGNAWKGWTEQRVTDLAAKGHIQGFTVKAARAAALPHQDGEEARKGTKYGSTATTCNGIKFQSKKEARRYRQLLLMEKAGLVKDILLQKQYILIPARFESYTIPGKRRPLARRRCVEKQVAYYADFVYYDTASTTTVVNDTKSDATRKLSTYVIKRKLMLSVYGIAILET